MSTAQHDVIYRPTPPPHPSSNPRDWGLEYLDGIYVVMQKGDPVVAYHSTYFRSTNEVVADLLGLISEGLEGLWSDDFVIWCCGRVMAVIHQPVDERHRRVVLFNDRDNDPIAGRQLAAWPDWPSYDEWVKSGRGDLWLKDPRS
jgi:hypothetical protein